MTGPYCWQHTQLKLHLKVADSKIKGAGKGLIAFDPKHKGEKDHVVFASDKKNLPGHPAPGMITPYQLKGNFKSKAQLGSGHHPYALEIADKQSTENYYANPKDTNNGLGRYPNDPGWDGKRYSTTGLWQQGKGINAKLIDQDVFHKHRIPRVGNRNRQIKEKKGDKNQRLKRVINPWVVVSPAAAKKGGIHQGEEIFVKYTKEGGYFTNLGNSSEEEEEVTGKVSKRKAAADRAERAKRRRQAKRARTK